LVNSVEQQPSETQETYEPVEERTFNSLKDTNPFQSILQKRQQSASRVSAEEINLKRRLEKLEGTRDPITNDLLKDEKGEFVNIGKINEAARKQLIIKAKLAGYSDVNEFRLAEAESRPPKPHLYSSQEEADADKAKIPFLKHAYEKALHKSEGIQGDIDIVKERQEEVAQSRFESLLSGELSKVDTRASSLSREAKTSLLSSSEVSKKPFFDYVENREQKQAELEQARQEVASLSQGVSTPEGRERFTEATNTLESKTQETAKAIALERAQKRGGFDRESQYEKASSLVQDIESKKESKEIKEKIKVGGEEGFKSLEDALKKLEKTSTTVTEAFKAFNKEIETNGKVTEKAAKALDEATKEHEKQQKVVKEFEKQGGGGPGWAKGAQEFSNVGLAVADAARYTFITSDIQQKQARAGVADIVNQEYFDYRAAAKGDMSALRRVSGMYRRQEKEAAELKLREMGVGSSETLLATAGAVGEAVEAQAGATMPWDKAVKAGFAGARGAAKVTKIGVDVGKEITSTNTYIQGFQAGKNLEDTTNAIADYHRQELFDYGRNMYSTLQGFGAESDKTAKSFASGESLSKFAELGFDPTQTLQLVGQASQTMGAAFTGASADKQQEITQRAATLDQARVMSAQQYMGNMGQLTQVGGGQKQMEEIMANAVARGVGNAKNISDIVGLVTGISAKTGAGTTAGVTELVNRSLSNLEKAMPGQENEALRQSTTASLIGRTSEMMTGTGMDFASVLGMAKINKEFGDISQTTRMNLKRGADTGSIAQMNKLLEDTSPEGQEKFKQFVESKGWGEAFYKDGKYIGTEQAKKRAESITNIGVEQVAATGVGLTTTEQMSDIKTILKGDKAEIEKIPEQRRIRAQDALVTMTGVEGSGTASKGLLSRDFKDIPKGKVGEIPKGEFTESQAQIDIARSKTDVKGVGTGAALEGKDVIDALSNMTKQFTKAMEDFKPGELQTKSVQASEKMTSDFSTVVNVDFKAAIKSLREAAELIKGARGIREFISTNYPEQKQQTTPLPDNKIPQSKKVQ
jgi:hypothetical protein